MTGDAQVWTWAANDQSILGKQQTFVQLLQLELSCTEQIRQIMVEILWINRNGSAIVSRYFTWSIVEVLGGLVKSWFSLSWWKHQCNRRVICFWNFCSSTSVPTMKMQKLNISSTQDDSCVSVYFRLNSWKCLLGWRCVCGWALLEKVRKNCNLFQSNFDYF